VKEISGNVAHTVDFIQGAITIILALALGEALKLFVTPHEEKPMIWNRLPSLLAFLFAFFPFFQSMSQYLYLTYLSPATAAPFRPGYLVFDAVMYVLEAACFFVMSRALAPKHWQHFYGAVLALMLIDIGWTALTLRRGIHVGAWLYIDIVVAAIVVGMFLFERNRPLTMRPVYVGLVLLMTSTAISYWLERDIYFP
jgi:hypothetical protein